MKTRKYNYLFIFLIFIIPNLLTAQNNISGNIKEITKSKPLKGVTIVISDLLDSSKTTLTTNENGFFSIPNLQKGDYHLTTNYLGYKSEERTFKVENKPIHFSFRLEPSDFTIEEVEIQAPSGLTLKGDTMEFNANNFSTREYADADELVAQIPGIIIDEEGNVSAHGEQVTRIIVDGKEFFSSDPRIALKTLPADIIAKIQLIDEKSEEARFTGVDDGKRNKIINIVTKPDRKKGQFGKLSLGKGDKDKFGTNASYNGFRDDEKFAINLMANNINETNFAEQGRGGIRRGNTNTDRGLSNTYAAAINYSNSLLNKKMELSADYDFRSLNTSTDILSDIEYLSAKQNNQYRTQNQFTDVTQKEHKFNARIKWNINKNNRLDIAPNFTLEHGLSNSSTDFETTIGRNSLLNKSNRSNENKNHRINFGGNVTFMHRLKKRGRAFTINVNGNYNNNEANGLNLAITSYYKNQNLSRIDTNNNNSLTNGYGSGINSKIAFTEPISKYSRLQANYSYRNTSNYSDKETFEFLAETGQLGELQDRLSNEFRNDYNFHSTGATYLYNRKDSLRIQVGANYQHGIRINDRIVPINLKTKADFNSILPNVALVYKISKHRNLELNYNTATKTPSINQVQDFINNQNELRITNGNPNLKQEYTHSLRFQYKDINNKSGRTLTTNATFDFINNKIVNSILLTDTSILLFEDIRLGAGGQYIVPININGAYNARLNNSYGLPIKKWKLNIQSNSRLFFNNDLAQINGELANSISYGFGQTLGLNSNFSKKYIVGMSYTIDGRYTQNPIAAVKEYKVFNHRVNASSTLEVARKIVISSNLIYVQNGGIMNIPSTESIIWNASIGYKILKKKNGEISIRGFDLLNRAQNINRRVNDTSISNITSNTLSRYFLMSFNYNLRQFNNKK